MEAQLQRLQGRTVIEIKNDGKTGNGKSSTLNQIANLLSPALLQPFKEDISPFSVTDAPQTISISRSGIEFKLTDNPGYLDANGNETMTQQCRQMAINNQNAPPNVLIHCIDARRRLSLDEIEILKISSSLFGAQIVNYWVFALTHCDEFINDPQRCNNIVSQFREQIRTHNLIPQLDQIPIIPTAKPNQNSYIDLFRAICDIVVKRPAPLITPQIPVVQVHVPVHHPSPPSDRVSFTHGVVLGGKRIW